MGDDLGVAGVGRLATEDDRRPLRSTEDLVEQRQPQLTVSRASEFGAEMGGPQPLIADLLLERIEDRLQSGVGRRELQPVEEQVERLDLLAYECVGPVELVLVLGLGLEVPSHAHSPWLVRRGRLRIEFWK